MNTNTTPKEFFLHLGATIALYATAIALINLAFSIINRFLPDVLQNYWSVSSIVWPVSMLIVLTPILYILEWMIVRDIVRFPEKREIWIRRWRIYLTLFLAGAVIAGDIIFLLNTYLNGEISSRFIWKILIVLLVAGVIFAYYILAKTAELSSGKAWRKAMAILGLIFIIAAVVGGFVAIGSPAKQRALRLDQQRVSDMNSIQYQITNYWQKTEKLPADLNALNDALSGYNVPLDPESKQVYEYEVTGPQSFKLCAIFKLPMEQAEYGRGEYYGAPYDSNQNWKHQTGRACFDRTIDPKLYPPVIQAQSR